MQGADSDKVQQVKINCASIRELQVLPRVGKATAESIFNFRDRIGNITPDNIVTITLASI